MGVIDLSAYKPTAGTLGDANQVRNGFSALETLLNGNVDNNNFGAGKIFDPLKLMQDGAVDGDAMVWSTAANAGAGGWVPSTTRKMLRTGLARAYTEVYNSAAISVPTGALTTVTFDTEINDDENLHSTVSNTSRITFPSAGLWLVGATQHWVVNGTGGRFMRLQKNGATPIADTDGTTQAAAVSDGSNTISVVHTFVATDYVELQVMQNSGGAVNLLGGGPYGLNTRLWAVRL